MGRDADVFNDIHKRNYPFECRSKGGKSKTMGALKFRTAPLLKEVPNLGKCQIGILPRVALYI